MNSAYASFVQFVATLPWNSILEKQGFWKKYFRLWNKKRSGLCRKSEKRSGYFFQNRMPAAMQWRCRPFFFKMMTRSLREIWMNGVFKDLKHLAWFILYKIQACCFEEDD
jgi:hypothetical protein